MIFKRTYGDSCAAAHALDLVGERWALLIIRELLLGPKRFSDLRQGIPNASPNVLSQRLHELAEATIVRRHRLGPPTSAWVYELTDWGLELEPVLVYLGRWGRRSPVRSVDADAHVSVDSVMLALRGHFDPDADPSLDATFSLQFEDDHFAVRVAAGRLDVVRGDVNAPDAVIYTDARTFAALMSHRQSLDEVLAAEKIRLTGDVTLVGRLFAVLPAGAPIRASVTG
jgi:DNA-binding HxlR family transcriptional regulator